MECCPGAHTALSTEISSATSAGRPSLAPWPTSSVMVTMIVVRGRQPHLVLGEVLGQGECDCHARLPVEVTRDDEAVSGELGTGDQPDEVADIEAELNQVLPC